MAKKLSDAAAEKGVLAGLYKFGRDFHIETCDIIHQPAVFTIEYNQVLYSCLRHIFEKLSLEHADVASLHSAAKDLGVDSLLESAQCRQHIEQVLAFYVERDNAVSLAKKVRRLHVARTVHDSLRAASVKVLEVTGNETASEIVSIAESSILDLPFVIGAEIAGSKRFGDGVRDYVADKIANPVKSVGVSTGFPLWDAAIGGGLRGGSINVIGARMKGFKSGMALNMGLHMARLGLPVLYIDTELAFKEQMPRLLAATSGVDINAVETGDFGANPTRLKAVQDAMEEIDSLPFHHEQVSNVANDDHFTLMRKWLHKVPGVTLKGKAKPCVIIYDYIKLMDSASFKDMAEHQAVGFLMTKLHGFATKFDIPILTFVQLNRDGISQETTAVASQSDRILWFCSNFSIFKEKSPEEMAEDSTGNYKLIPLALRHGPGLRKMDYINVNVDGSHFQIREGKLRSQVAAEVKEDGETDF